MGYLETVAMKAAWDFQEPKESREQKANRGTLERLDSLA